MLVTGAVALCFGGPVGGASLKGKRKVTGHGAFKRRGGSRGAARGADESSPRKIPE